MATSSSIAIILVGSIFVGAIGFLVYAIIKKRRRRKAKYAGLTNDNNSCFFNVCIQIIASMNDMCAYLERSTLKKESLTKSLNRCLTIMKNKHVPIYNGIYYDMIMKILSQNKHFWVKKDNSADEFFCYLIKLLLEEEISAYNKKIKPYELTTEEYKFLKENSFIFNNFFIVNFDKRYEFMIYTIKLNEIQSVIDRFLSGNNEYTVPQWTNINLIHQPKYLCMGFTSDCFNTSDFDFQKNKNIFVNSSCYEFKAAVLYHQSTVGLNHYKTVINRSNELILFDDENVEDFNKKKIKKRKIKNYTFDLRN